MLLDEFHPFLHIFLQIHIHLFNRVNSFRSQSLIPILVNTCNILLKTIPSISLRTKQLAWFILSLIPHLGTGTNPITHIIIPKRLIALFLQPLNLLQRTIPPKSQLLICRIINKIHRTSTTGQYIQHLNPYKSTIQSIFHMKCSVLIAFIATTNGVVGERCFAEEVLKALFGYLASGVFVDGHLVYFEEIEFFFGVCRGG
mmetsp:Transcript_767/g.803  ORF Transcript_767/g.803 Transcript_767/m.803 type:complete len:200 (+) Transcript_767:266-865(+)